MPIEDPILQPEKTVTGFAILTYAWVIVLSMWGGMANYVSKVRSGHIARFNFTELIGDLCISGFTGVITFYMCQAAGFDELVAAVLVGISGHMGARMIGKLEKMMSRKLNLADDEVAGTIVKKGGTPGVF